MTVVHHAVGNYSKAIDLSRRVMESVVSDPLGVRFGPMLTSVISRTYLGWSLAERRQFAEAMTLAEEAVRIADGADYLSQAFACWVVGLVTLHKGDVDRAIPALERGFHLREVAELALVFPLIISWLGSAYALSGRMGEGLPLLERAVEPAANFRTWQSVVLINLSQGYLLGQRIEDAMRLAESVLDLTRERKERGQEAWALRLLGEIALQQNPPDVATAEVHYGEAMVLASELGMRLLQAHCHLGLGKLYQRTGDGAKTQEYLTTAATMYRKMDMGFWLAQAEGALKEPGPRAGR
jgi:tetratricopeptide (TPR) repeat protein